MMGWARRSCLVVSLALVAPVASACTTPVYQFAMNNWQRSGYHVRYFHSAADGDADAEANALLRAASREGG
ncbi:MAG: hypothetical protein U9R79_09425, partial [Armatimonadota bacterium]|nr:hypothetical protein [Armatimonadota bacterium]